MLIRSGSVGEVRRILILSDELLFLAPILPLLFIDQSSSALLVEGLAIVSILELISRLIIFRKRGIRLTDKDAPGTFTVLRQELLKQPVLFGVGPLLYWAPNDFRRGARVLGGFRSKLLLTGGTVVENEENPGQAAIILRHELAHIRGGDTRMYLYFLLLIGNAFVALAEGVQSGGDSMEFIEALIGLTLSYFIYFKLLLRRREFLADARAVNISDSRQEYIDILLGRYPPEGKSSGFHPSNDERAGAVSFDSPVLSRSYTMIALAFMYIVLHTVPLMESVERYRYPSDSDRWFLFPYFIILNAAPILVIAIELLKGKKMKYPLASGEKPSAREQWLSL